MVLTFPEKLLPIAPPVILVGNRPSGQVRPETENVKTA
jgi:hypothetical protein